MTTHNQQLIEIDGTSLQGYIEADYANLLRAFGEPTEGDGYKTDAEWEVMFDDGLVATIYNWKNGHNYLGWEGIATADINSWNVGGNEPVVVERLQKMMTCNHAGFTDSMDGSAKCYDCGLEVVGPTA